MGGFLGNTHQGCQHISLVGLSFPAVPPLADVITPTTCRSCCINGFHTYGLAVYVSVLDQLHTYIHVLLDPTLRFDRWLSQLEQFNR